MKIYVLDKFCTSMLEDYPSRLIIDNITKHQLFLDIIMRTKEDVLVNGIMDDDTLGYLRNELNINLEKPEKVPNVNLKRGDAVVLIIKRDKQKYEFYEIILFT